MTPFSPLSAVAAPYPVANVDTDQVLPSEFLKKVDREGLGDCLFFEARFDEAGREKPDFILNRLGYRDAGILIAGANFGCGSARETAPWALLDFGIRCVIAPSFADIFRLNCINNGLLPVRLDQPEVDTLAAEAASARQFTVDLPGQRVRAPSGRTFSFAIDPLEKRRLLEGLNPIGATLRRIAEIEAFETRRRSAHS